LFIFGRLLFYGSDKTRIVYRDNMAKVGTSIQAGLLPKRGTDLDGISFRPYWARSRVQYAQNLLESSSEPIEYDYEDEDYWDNCFFFPEDCARAPVKDRDIEDSSETDTEPTTSGLSDVDSDLEDMMTPELPGIKMLDTEALGDLLDDNLSPPEITSIL
jgi:hypothetical protein